MQRLTTDKRKIFARENPTLMSMNKDELRRHYNEIFDRLQAYEVEEEKKIYCGNCRSWCKAMQECTINGMHVEDSDFCSKGKRNEV